MATPITIRPMLSWDLSRMEQMILCLSFANSSEFPPIIPSLKIPFAKHRRAGCTSGPSQVSVQSWRKRVHSGPMHWSPAIKPGNPTREQYPENSVGELAFHSILSWKIGRCCWSPEDVCHWHAFLPSTFMAISATRTEYGIRTPWACHNGQSKQTKMDRLWFQK